MLALITNIDLISLHLFPAMAESFVSSFSLLFCACALSMIIILICSMIFLPKRVIVLCNNLENMVIELRVTLYPTDFVQTTFTISPGSYKEIDEVDLTTFHDNNPERPVTIWVYANGSYKGFFFSSHDFITFAKIRVGEDTDKRIIISGIKAPCIHQAHK